jgi:hypothetical protein
MTPFFSWLLSRLFPNATHLTIPPHLAIFPYNTKKGNHSHRNNTHSCNKMQWICINKEKEMTRPWYTYPWVTTVNIVFDVVQSITIQCLELLGSSQKKVTNTNERELQY